MQFQITWCSPQAAIIARLAASREVGCSEVGMARCTQVGGAVSTGRHALVGQAASVER